MKDSKELPQTKDQRTRKIGDPQHKERRVWCEAGPMPFGDNRGEVRGIKKSHRFIGGEWSLLDKIGKGVRREQGGENKGQDSFGRQGKKHGNPS